MMNEQDVNTYLNFLSGTAFEILYVLEDFVIGKDKDVYP